MSKSARKLSAVPSAKLTVVGMELIDPATLVIDTAPGSRFFDPTFRHDLPVDVALYASIMDKGVIKPIAVSAHDKRTVIDGRQRTAAAKQGKLKAVPVVVVDVPEGLDNTDIALLIVELNKTAQAVEDLAAAKVAADAIAKGKSRAQVAMAMGLTDSRLDAFIAIANAPAETVAAVANGTISLSGAAIVAALPAKLQGPVIQQAVEDRVAINAASPGKASKAPTGTATNLDLRSVAAAARNKTLPASASRSTDGKVETFGGTATQAVTKPEKARTGGFNAAELAAFKDALEETFKSYATDATVAPVLLAVAQALNAAATGDATKFVSRNKATEVVRASFDKVRASPAAK